MHLSTIVLCRLMLGAFLVVASHAGAEAAKRFYISIPGPTLSYVPLYYGQEKGFFTQEGLDLQILVVRGIVGVSSLMSGEIDVTCHAGSGLSAALRGVPVKVIPVTRDRPIHELVVAPAAIHRRISKAKRSRSVRSTVQRRS
jgi:ABC-type nitrate/sulfonate/bicarbonate transport system substrate-binding protein